jgi:glutaminase
MRTDALRTETYARRSACPVQDVLNDIFKRLQRDRSGEVASYTPELRKANPEWFAACLVTADGKIYEVGETHQTFTIQSISKPFVYRMARASKCSCCEIFPWLSPGGCERRIPAC